MRLAFLLFTLLIIFTCSNLIAQDSLSFGFSSVINSDKTPFWIYSNNNGIIDKSQAQVYNRLIFSSKKKLSRQINFEFGFDFVARYSQNSSVFFNHGFIQLYNDYLKFSAGRFDNTSIIYNNKIGMGSLGVSGNSTPVPQVRIGTNKWVYVPFTKKRVEFKGHVAHGWLQRENYIDKTLYHEKIGHLRFGGDAPFNFYGGLSHYAIWGGKNHPEFGDLPSTFNDFLRIFIAVGGDENAPPGDQNYILGDHLGAWEAGFKLEISHMTILLYRQFPLETKENLRFETLEDGLGGIDIKLKKPVLGIRNIIYEFLYTKNQRGPFRPDPENARYPFKGNENYYNNDGFYRSGWIYNSFTIGNPLFIPRDYDIGVGNNRIVAHHIGAQVMLKERFESIIKITYSNNHGNWGSRILDRPEMGRAYIPPKKQLSTSIFMNYKTEMYNFPVNLYFQTSVDYGELVGNNLGIRIGGL